MFNVQFLGVKISSMVKPLSAIKSPWHRLVYLLLAWPNGHWDDSLIMLVSHHLIGLT